MGHEDNMPLDGRRRRLLGVGLGVGAAAVAVAIAVTLALSGATAASDRSAAPATTAASTSSAAASKTAPVPGAKRPAPETTPTVDADPAALADLHAVAATLTSPTTLTSPAGWDRWLPAGKPYPGKDTADDMSTCPRLSDRLGAALGTKMSYWTGTLPGPGGCTWATVPLYAGPNAPNYPYLANVNFQADGTTTEQLSRHFYHHEGRLCPSVAVPAAGDGAYLVRCEELDGITYTVITRDTRTAGIWSLSGSARSDAGRPATDVLRPVIEGAVAAFG
jgi:hypothetical protein